MSGDDEAVGLPAGVVEHKPQHLVIVGVVEDFDCGFECLEVGNIESHQLVSATFLRISSSCAHHSSATSSSVARPKARSTSASVTTPCLMSWSNAVLQPRYFSAVGTSKSSKRMTLHSGPYGY